MVTRVCCAVVKLNCPAAQRLRDLTDERHRPDGTRYPARTTVGVRVVPAICRHSAISTGRGETPPLATLVCCSVAILTRPAAEHTRQALDDLLNARGGTPQW